MPKVPFYSAIIEIRLYYEDQYTKGSNGLKTVQELADFLKDNTEIGKGVNYVPKRKN